MIDRSSLKTPLRLIGIAALVASLWACEQDGPLEEAGESIDEAIEEVGDEIDDATDDG